MVNAAERIEFPRGLALVLLFFVGLLTGVGTWWAFDRGGHDFNVFYHAWNLVLNGEGATIYSNSPDRFLYAPGFAWLLAPLAWIPRDLALAIWCFGKAAITGFVVREFGRRLLGLDALAALALGALGVLSIARPLLVDFQYGQINVMILGACTWALLSHFERGPGSRWDALPWVVLSVFAVGKVFPAPLLLVPFFVTKAVPARRVLVERIGVLAGIALVLLIPAASVGFPGALDLLLQWKTAIMSKGIPMESHNQSFAAMLYHFFSGAPTHLIFEGPQWRVLGPGGLSEATIRTLAFSWGLIMTGILLGWILNGSSRAPLKWVAVSIALLIVPSHLVWKPYFVLALPVAILGWYRAIVDLKRESVARLSLMIVAFIGMNLTSFDIIGGKVAAWTEAGSLMLFVHLLLALIA